MVSDDRSSGGVKAHLVNGKGIQDGWIDKRMAEDTVDFGYRGADIRTKCDQEPAITEVQQRLAVLRKGSRTVPVNSPVGDSKSNGRVENSIKRIQGMIRTLRHCLESKIGIRVSRGHPLYPWIIEWAADLITRYQVGSDGLTAVQRIRGAKSARAIAQFGEKTKCSLLCTIHAFHTCAPHGCDVCGATCVPCMHARGCRKRVFQVENSTCHCLCRLTAD